MLKRVEPGETAAADVRGGLPQLFPLVVSGLVYATQGRRLLDGVDMTLDGRTRTVVLGPNGAGKSLLLRLLHGLVHPTGGSIAWNGRPPSEAIRSGQALVFQRATLLRRSAEANIRFVLTHLPRAEREARTASLLHDVKLAHVARTPARLLSGGEQQRLALARARALEPRVLFLDEPTASLDPASTHAIEEQIGAIHAGGTKIVLVTHDIGQARRLADEIVFIDKGRVTEATPAEEFFARPRSAAARAYLEGRLLL